MESGGSAPGSPGGTQAQEHDFPAPGITGAEHREGSDASKVEAWTAGGLRHPASPAPLPPMQFELFTEAGAIVAERAAWSGASREFIGAVLRRSAEQARALLSDDRRSDPAVREP
jgi:hypothetical protein